MNPEHDTGMDAAGDYHIDRYGNLWITSDDGGRRLATSRERLRILQEETELALQLAS